MQHSIIFSTLSEWKSVLMICSSNSHTNIGRRKENFLTQFKVLLVIHHEKVWVLSTQNQTLRCEKGWRRISSSSIMRRENHNIYHNFSPRIYLSNSKISSFPAIVTASWHVVACCCLAVDDDKIYFESTHSHVMYASFRGYLRHTFINNKLQGNKY